MGMWEGLRGSGLVVLIVVVVVCLGVTCFTCCSTLLLVLHISHSLRLIVYPLGYHPNSLLGIDLALETQNIFILLNDGVSFYLASLLF